MAAGGAEAGAAGATAALGGACIVMVAPNGARRTRADHPALPIGPDALAATARAGMEAGASAIHFHVRDREGRHTLDPDAYRAALGAIRQAVGDGLVCQVTTEAVGCYTPAEQMALVRALRPEAVSLALRELVPDAAGEAAAASFLRWLAEETDCLPQVILHDASDLDRFADLRRRGVIPDGPASLLFVLGRYADGQAGHPRELPPLVAAMPGDCLFSVCCFGPTETACALTAAALGGHSRVGFENNTKLVDGRDALDNADQVTRLAGALHLLGRPPAEASHTREVFSRYRLAR
ncbi:MAG: 3-keto-5-aminohexanoate cleavage protein [Azospirillaceae bacterium]